MPAGPSVSMNRAKPFSRAFRRVNVQSVAMRTPLVKIADPPAETQSQVKYVPLGQTDEEWRTEEERYI